MKKILFLVAFAFVAVVGADTASATGSGWLYTQSCTLSAGANDILVDFEGARIFSDRYPNVLSKSVSIPAGRYDVYVQSFDGYKGRSYTSASTQKNEQFSIDFRSGSYIANTTHTTPDLQDGVDKAHWSGKLNTNMGLGRDIDKVFVRHAVKYYNSNPNSLMPVCMVLKPRPIDGACNSAFDGKDLDSKPRSNLCETGPASSVSGNGSQSSPWMWTCGGVNGGNTDHCKAYKSNVCGDGIVAGGEQCDDGNTKSGDGCSSMCKVETPAIKIIKRDASDKDDTQTVDHGKNATFQIVVKNTGEVDLKNVVVTDAQTPACNKNIGNLAVGQSHAYTCVATNVTKDFTNIANVTGTPVDGQSKVTDKDPTDVVVKMPGTPAIKIIKRDASDKDDTQTVDHGKNATFQIVVKNTGEVDLKNVVVTDAQTPACNKNIGNLAVGQSHAYTCVATNVTKDFTNIANVTGTPVDGQSKVTDKDPTDVVVTEPGTPAIKIIKRDASDKDDTQTVDHGKNATFQIVVKNTGEVDLKNVVVTDAQTPACNKNIGNLAVGQSHAYTCVATNVTKDFTNIANVTGTPVDGQSKVTDKDPTDVVVKMPGTPAIKIIKRDASDKDDTQTVDHGKNATFQIVVKNTGEVDLKNVVVTDAQTPACNKNIGNLAVGQSHAYTCVATNVTKDFTNIANVTGTPVDGQSKVTDKDPTDVVVKMPGTPAIKIIKRDASDKDDTQTIEKGGDASFQIVVKNTGEVDLKDVKVRDPYASVCNKDIGDLAVGESHTYTCVTEGVMESYTNVARVTGTPVDGQDKVTDKDPTEIVVTEPGTPAIKIIKRDASDKDDTQTIEKGGDASFEIVVTNTGDVDLKDVSVTDAKESDCNKNIGDLAAGESHTYTCESTNVTESFTNIAKVTGTPIDGQDRVTDEDPTEITVRTPQGPICGNGIKESGEQCDDGNTSNGDGCSATCTVERVIVDPVCGNGIKESGEQCDDGNRSNNDECSNQCKIIEEEEEEEDDDDCDAEVGDTVFNDRNRNGVQDAGESGLSGIRVKLQYGDKVKKTRTDSNGEYEFDDLCEDNYRVIIGTESLDAGCYQTYDRDGKLDHMNKVGLDEGEDYEKVDFGYHCPAAYTPRHVEHRPVSPRTGAGPLAGGAAAVFASGAVWIYQRRQMQGSVEKSIITFDN